MSPSSHCPKHYRYFSNKRHRRYRHGNESGGLSRFQRAAKAVGVHGHTWTFPYTFVGFIEAVGVSFVGFIVFSIALGKLAGFIAMLVMIIAGLVTIYIKQRGGLHNKRKDKGVFVYKSLRKKS